jgi:amyloid beta precursor protein binding protein 1
VVKRRSIAEELESPDWFEDVQGELANSPEAHCPKWLLTVKAFEQISDQANPAIGQDMAKGETDLEQLKAEVKSMTDTFSPDSGVEDKYLKELLRFGRTKLHNVSAFLGGIASQEACKLVMSQYIPINHTFIYDGIHGTGQNFAL